MAEIWEGTSPTVYLIREHYHRSLQLESWNNARIGRLCKSLSCSLQELCALAGVFGQARIRTLWQRGEEGKPWPVEIILHFANLQKFHDERTFQTASAPNAQEIQTALLLSK